MKKYLSIAVLFILSFAHIAVAQENLPELGNPDRLSLTSMEEAKMGKEFMETLNRSGAVLADPVAGDYLTHLGNRLVAASQKKSRDKIDFHIIMDKNINAFAGPNGHIVVNSGLILTAKSESELASVLAHEIAHVTQKHLASLIAEMSQTKVQSVATALAALAVGILNPQAAPHAIAVAMAGTQQNMLNFSRAHEHEADRIGIGILEKAGFNPKEMLKFLRNLQQEERYYDKVPAWVMTHPITEDRLADIAHRATAYSYEKSESSLEFYITQERLRIFSSDDPHELLTYYQRTLDKETYANKDATEYGYSLALIVTQQYKPAIDQLEKLTKSLPQNVPVQLALSYAYSENHQDTDALNILKKLHDKDPKNYTVMLTYAQLLLDTKKSRQSLIILQNYMLSHPDSIKPYDTLARAQNANGLIAEAYQTRSRYYHEKGDLKQAQDQLQIALNLPNLNAEAKKHIQAKMDVVQQEMKVKRS